MFGDLINPFDFGHFESEHGSAHLTARSIFAEIEIVAEEGNFISVWS